jgi:hypothetical protein
VLVKQRDMHWRESSMAVNVSVETRSVQSLLGLQTVSAKSYSVQEIVKNGVQRAQDCRYIRLSLVFRGSRVQHLHGLGRIHSLGYSLSKNIIFYIDLIDFGVLREKIVDI